MKKKSNNRLIPYLGEFLTIYLPKQRNCSQHTITSSMQTWNMLLGYVSGLLKKNVEAILFSDLNRTMVMQFLDEMEKERGWTASTRNQRLSNIRAFFQFAASVEPVLVIYLEGLRGIPLKKSPDKSRTFEFMTPEAINVLLKQPDVSTKMGIRDLFYMVLMYDTAARDGEMLSLRLGDIKPNSRTVLLQGKGAKQRIVPISENTAQHFRRYKKLFHAFSDETSPMFYIVRHGVKTKMSDDNVARFLAKYCAKARDVYPDIPKRVSPHMIRRSRAMHLYRSGMPLEILAQWLGHAQPETTLIYAYADVELKRKAIEKAENNGSTRLAAEVGVWNFDDEIIKRLRGLT